MRKIVIICLVFMFVGINFNYAGALNKPDNSDEELLKFGVKFIPPSGWQKVKLQGVPSAIYFTSPDKKANISVSLPKQAPLASFGLSINMLRIYKKPISEAKIVFQNVPCYVFVFYQINKNGLKIKTKDYQFFKDGKVYSIDFSADATLFDNYLSEFENALSAFEVLE